MGSAGAEPNYYIRFSPEKQPSIFRLRGLGALPAQAHGVEGRGPLVAPGGQLPVGVQLAVRLRGFLAVLRGRQGPQGFRQQVAAALGRVHNEPQALRSLHRLHGDTAPAAQVLHGHEQGEVADRLTLAVQDIEGQAGPLRIPGAGDAPEDSRQLLHRVPFPGGGMLLQEGESRLVQLGGAGILVRLGGGGQIQLYLDDPAGTRLRVEGDGNPGGVLLLPAEADALVVAVQAGTAAAGQPEQLLHLGPVPGEVGGQEGGTPPPLGHHPVQLLPHPRQARDLGDGLHLPGGAGVADGELHLVIGENPGALKLQGPHGVGPGGGDQHRLPGGGQIRLHVPGVVVEPDGAAPPVPVHKVQDGLHQSRVSLRPEDGLVLLLHGVVHMDGGRHMAPLQQGGAAAQGQQAQAEQQGQHSFFHGATSQLISTTK